MPTDRVLIEIVTAANMAGIEQANKGMFGLNASTLALGLALGALVIVGKSAIENTEKQEKAHRSLQQAADVSKKSFKDLQTQFDQWSEANKRYIPDQYAAEEALAAFVRTGVPAKTAMEELNVALDLSTLKSEDMATAQETIIKALAGNSRGLKDLGITTEEYNKIVKDKHLTNAQKQIELLQLMETRTKDGRKAQTDLSQSTNALNKDWQDITTQVGPPLLSLLTFIATEVDNLVTWLDALGHNKDWNAALYSGLGQVQNALIDVVKGFEDIVGAVKWLIDNGGRVKNFLGAAKTSAGNFLSALPSASGYSGTVSQPTLFLAGEAGSEYVNISPSGRGRSGGNNVTINIYGTVIDGPALDQFTNQIAQRLIVTTGL